MGLLDFLKVTTSGKKKQAAQAARAAKKTGPTSCGTVKIDSFTFNVKDYNLKGFIIEPYDKDVLVQGQRFRFEISVSKGSHKMSGPAEAVVTKITDTALAAGFTIKPFDH